MKNDGYTFIETILAIGILSILLWNIVPQLIQIEKKGTLLYQRIIEKTSTTKLVHTLSLDISDIHWRYWQQPPQIHQKEKSIYITWVDEENQEHSYQIIQEDTSIVIMKDSSIRKFNLPSLEFFNVTVVNDNKADISFDFSTGHQLINLPLRFGSKAICIYE